jgi:Ser/Thr protein kinase RdoA (MazF antagonist)
MKHDIKKIKEIAGKFPIYGDFISAAPYGSGHINDTYAVAFNQAGASLRYIFQRINHDIFENPPALMENIKRVTSHQAMKLAGYSDSSRRTLTVVDTRDGQPYHLDEEGNYWRVYPMIEGAQSHDILETPTQAFNAAKAFGGFQKLLVDMPGGRLHETIPHFHDTPKRLAALKEAIEKDSANRAALAKPEIDFVMEREAMASKLLDLHAEGKIPERVTHNDTKLNNVLIDEVTNEGLCVIDLDTVMPGLALYDFGDMVRTGTSPAAEDERDLSKVRARMEMFTALLEGYLAEAHDFLNATEKELLPFSGMLITFEIGIRFLTDFLSGDVYFKTSRPEHNLDRCRTQFKLVESLESQEDALNSALSTALEKASAGEL